MLKYRRDWHMELIAFQYSWRWDKLKGNWSNCCSCLCIEVVTWYTYHCLCNRERDELPCQDIYNVSWIYYSMGKRVWPAWIKSCQDLPSEDDPQVLWIMVIPLYWLPILLCCITRHLDCFASGVKEVNLIVCMYVCMYLCMYVCRSIMWRQIIVQQSSIYYFFCD